MQTKIKFASHQIQNFTEILSVVLKMKCDGQRDRHMDKQYAPLNVHFMHFLQRTSCT